jgi:hypothetical protein
MKHHKPVGIKKQRWLSIMGTTVIPAMWEDLSPRLTRAKKHETLCEK